MSAKKNALLGGFLLISLALITAVTLMLRDVSLKGRTSWTVYFGEESLVAAGSVVPPGTVIPPGSLVRGIPGRVVRETTAEERASSYRSSANASATSPMRVSKSRSSVAITGTVGRTASLDNATRDWKFRLE